MTSDFEKFSLELTKLSLWSCLPTTSSQKINIHPWPQADILCIFIHLSLGITSVGFRENEEDRPDGLLILESNDGLRVFWTNTVCQIEKVLCKIDN